MGRHSRRSIPPEVPAEYWKASQAYILAVITLALGVLIGYLVRGSASSQSPTKTASPSQQFTQQFSSSDILARTVSPLLTQLQSQPNDLALLVEIGNAYYDGQDYAKAIDYYQRSLKLRPGDVNVRTDMGTAMWYSGDPDGALKQYEQSLKYDPTHPNTLMNMGIVKWNGKKDGTGAIASWERLLASNPTFPQRQKVEDLIQSVKRELGSSS